MTRTTQIRRKQILMIGVIFLVLLTSCTYQSGTKTLTPSSLPSTKGDSGVSGNSGMALQAATNEPSPVFITTYGEKVFDDVTVTVMILDRGTAPEGESLTDNRWTEYVNEQMNKVGITIRYVPVKVSDALNSVNFMMAMQNAADIMVCSSGPAVLDYFKNDRILELSSYIDGRRQARNLKRYVTTSVLDCARLSSFGKLYAIPAQRINMASTNLFIRKDWLDALSLEVPTTVEEMTEVLLAFQKYNPGNVDHLVPASFLTSGELGPMAGSFLTSISDELSYSIAYPEINGMTVYYDDGYIEYLRYLNSLYHQGLLDPEFFTYSDYRTMVTNLILEGRVGVFEMAVNGTVDSTAGCLLQTLRQTDPNAELISIPPLKNTTDGNIYNPGYTISGDYIFLPSTCKNPEAAITYLDWLATVRGGYILYHGFEGEHYTLQKDSPLVIDPAYNATNKDWIRQDLFLLGANGYYTNVGQFLSAAASELPGYETYVNQNYYNAGIGLKTVKPMISAATAENRKNLQSVCDTHLVKAITCNQDAFDQAVTSFKLALEQSGIRDAVAERTSYFYKLLHE